MVMSSGNDEMYQVLQNKPNNCCHLVTAMHFVAWLKTFPSLFQLAGLDQTPKQTLVSCQKQQKTNDLLLNRVYYVHVHFKNALWNT